MWDYLSLFRFQHVFFCSAQVCAWWHLASPTTISLLFGEGTESFHCSTRGMPAGQSPRNCCWEGPARLGGGGGWCPPLELILLFPLVWVMHCPIQSLTELCFSVDFNTKMQGTEVFGLVLLVTHNKCHLLVTLWTSFLPWNWKNERILTILPPLPNFLWISQVNPIIFFYPSLTPESVTIVVPSQ